MKAIPHARNWGGAVWARPSVCARAGQVGAGMGVPGRWGLGLPCRDGALCEVLKRRPSPHRWSSEMTLRYILEEVERVSVAV